MTPQVEHCLERIAEEEAYAAKANSSEVAHLHQQVAMLYKAQLASMSRGGYVGSVDKFRFSREMNLG